MENRLLGKPVVANLKKVIKDKIKESNKQHSIAFILPTKNEASLSYLKSCQKVCDDVGVTLLVHSFDGSETEEELMQLVSKLNVADDIDGIMIDRPFPKGINETNVYSCISPHKDIDGCSPLSSGLLFQNQKSIAPSTAEAVIDLLDYYGVELQGKQVVIVNRSKIVGLPLALLLLHRNATVCICHTKTQDLKKECSRADIVVTAIGQPHFFTPDYFNPTAIIVDIGISFNQDGALCGDVSLPAQQSVQAYTPVPGGIGPITSVILIKNMLKGQGIW